MPSCLVNEFMAVGHWDGNSPFGSLGDGDSVGTNLTEDAANSTLWVARVKPADSGNYTCSVGPQLSSTTSVHVLNGKVAHLIRHMSHTTVWRSFSPLPVSYF